METVQAVKKLYSISRERLNFRRRPILCTTLYRNPMQASNFGGTFDQLFLRIFLYNFHRRCLSISSIPWCKKVKNDQKLKSTGGPALREKRVSFLTRGVLCESMGACRKWDAPLLADSRERCAFFVDMSCRSRSDGPNGCGPGQSVHLMMP